jgi:hypothetical protein
MYDKAIKLGPENLEAFYNKITFLNFLEKKDEIEKVYYKAKNNLKFEDFNIIKNLYDNIKKIEKIEDFSIPIKELLY